MNNINNDLEKEKYWIWFSRIKKIGIKKKIKLINKWKDPKIIYALCIKDLKRIEWISKENIEGILDKSIRLDLDRYIDYMKSNSIDIISIFDEDYPDMLRNIYDPPISLYIKGNKNILNNISIGIVGCRQATDYGKNAARYFSYNLAKNGISIVSGLAKGIDSYAHLGTLCGDLRDDLGNEGKTIAVIGSGIDIIYPKENNKLYNQIIEKGGAIISEYPLGTKPEKMNFPARNRIISGLSRGIIVIEAKEKSGTLITVDFALEQGRDVFALPGNINSINSIGTNKIIKEGAKLVTNYKDILKELGKLK